MRRKIVTEILVGITLLHIPRTQVNRFHNLVQFFDAGGQNIKYTLLLTFRILTVEE